MKKLTALTLALTMTFVLTGCMTDGQSDKSVVSTGNTSGAKSETAVLEQPPVLTVVSDEISVTALLGPYSWQRKNVDGSFTAVEADSLHPLDCRDLLSPPLETSETTAMLKFAEDPDRIASIQCWSDSNWSNPSAKGEDVLHNGNTIEVNSDGHIYEVVAQWDTDSGYGGTAHYSFYITAE